MKIETKFNIGQKVYVIDKNYQCIYYNKHIDNIRIIIGKDYFKISYEIGGLEEYEEKYIFGKLEEAEQKLKEMQDVTDN